MFIGGTLCGVGAYHPSTHPYPHLLRQDISGAACIQYAVLILHTQLRQSPNSVILKATPKVLDAEVYVRVLRPSVNERRCTLRGAFASMTSLLTFFGAGKHRYHNGFVLTMLNDINPPRNWLSWYHTRAAAAGLS